MKCKGYYAWQNACMFNTTTSTTSTTSGNTYSFGNSYNTQYSWDTSKFLINVGVGTEEAKISDTNLKKYFSTGTVSYSTLVGNKTFNSEGALVCNLNVGVTNISTETIQIKEAGLFWKNSSDTTGKVLLARQVFDEPIEVAPGESTYIRARLI